MSASTSPPFRNLIRFLDESLVEHYGDVPNGSLDHIVGSTVQVLTGDFFDLKRSGDTAIVHELLCPIPSTPLLVCVGLNYVDHAKEANLEVPPNPVIFTKPADALNGPDCDVRVPPEAKLMDYEGEFCIVIGKTGKDISKEAVRSHILGFTAGNDLSSRYWQRAPRSGGQYCFAKSFDGFAPIGPTILHGSCVDSNTTFELETRVNGEIRQKATNQDMIFSIEEIVAHVSKGTTLRKGTVIMTGTPAGIAAKWRGGTWLKNDDVVEINVSRIGRLRNKLLIHEGGSET